MPSVSVAVPHALPEEEAARRLKVRYDAVKTSYASEIKDLHEEWDGNSLRCRFSTFGMKVSGTVTAEPGLVRVLVDLPFVAMMFKGRIEEKIREELGTLLA